MVCLTVYSILIRLFFISLRSIMYQFVWLKNKYLMISWLGPGNWEDYPCLFQRCNTEYCKWNGFNSWVSSTEDTDCKTLWDHILDSHLAMGSADQNKSSWSFLLFLETRLGQYFQPYTILTHMCRIYDRLGIPFDLYKFSWQQLLSIPLASLFKSIPNK